MEQTNISRKDFLKNLGLSGAALWAVYCTGTLTSCKNDEAPPAQNPTNSNKLDFNIDLNDSNNSKLKTNGGFIVKNDIVIARTTAGKYVAVTVVCTHQQFKTVVYQNGEFFCTTHGSRFDETGKVVGGPAKTNIQQYQTSINGNTLRVFEA
jgi:cytochrome b6-f complex iron-sulfur subunit